MAETVCSEVRRLGNHEAIMGQVLAHQRKELVDYVLQRPNNALSARDYLSDRMRSALKITACIVLYVHVV